LWRLGQREDALRKGADCLAMKDRHGQVADTQRVAPRRPRPFNPHQRERNIIAYSLFGEDRYYHEGALANARIALADFSDFLCRFYCGEEVPDAVIQGLIDMGADVRRVTPRKPPWIGLFWRFWAFDDPDVDVVLVRDVDTPLSTRERLAVEDWLHASEAPFHVMRDRPGHMEPMMAGLWGGFTGLLPPLQPLSQRHVAQDNSRFADQTFLRQSIWPRIREATLAHDSHYALRDSRPFPSCGRMYAEAHVGMSWPRRGSDRRALV
jgi:hypothetical protein